MKKIIYSNGLGVTNDTPEEEVTLEILYEDDNIRLMERKKKVGSISIFQSMPYLEKYSGNACANWMVNIKTTTKLAHKVVIYLTKLMKVRDISFFISFSCKLESGECVVYAYIEVPVPKTYRHTGLVNILSKVGINEHFLKNFSISIYPRRKNITFMDVISDLDGIVKRTSSENLVFPVVSMGVPHQRKIELKKLIKTITITDSGLDWENLINYSLVQLDDENPDLKEVINTIRQRTY